MLSNFSKSVAAVVFATSAVTGVTHAEPQSPQKMNSVSKRACDIVHGTRTGPTCTYKGRDGMVTVTQLPEGCKADVGMQSKVFTITCNGLLKNIPEMTAENQEQIKKRSPIN